MSTVNSDLRFPGTAKAEIPVELMMRIAAEGGGIIYRSQNGEKTMLRLAAWSLEKDPERKASLKPS